MRLRNIPNAKEKLLENKQYFLANNKNAIKSIFIDKDKTYQLEIGIGKGDFLIKKATNNQAINFIGIEKYASILIKVKSKLEKLNTKLVNLKIQNIDCLNLLEFYQQETFSKIYLNFSDPWPKKRHSKRRLTYKTFLEIYYSLLKKDGILEFKTDNQALFLFTLKQLEEFKKFKISKRSKNLYQDIKTIEYQTEYEIKFLNKELPIFYLEIVKL